MPIAILIIFFVVIFPIIMYWNFTHYNKVNESANDAKKAREENQELRDEMKALREEVNKLKK